MADPYDHLAPAAREVIALPATERIARMRSRRFAEYPRCRHVLDLMAEQIDRTGQHRVDRRQMRQKRQQRLIGPCRAAGTLEMRPG